VPAHRRVRERPSGLGEQLIERLRPRGMRLTGQHPHLIHDSQHAPSLAGRERQITQPRRATSQPAVVVLGQNLTQAHNVTG
jgi:hypothetical protein